MDNKEIYKHVDHTLLKQTATLEEIVKLCNEAIEHECASVCIPPSYVKSIREIFPTLNICTAIGFPNGYSTLETKMFETMNAIENGANEIDIVLDITNIKNKRFDLVSLEIRGLRDICYNKILKVIIETCYLTEEEKIECCKCVTEEKADYIKTSTGFGSAGASIEDIRLFKKYIGPNVKIKAAGGIRTKEDMEMFINEGCDRIGCSAAVKVLG